jgi:hypothetical protein
MRILHGNIHEMLCEARIMYGVEVCGLDEAWKEADKSSWPVLQETARSTDISSEWYDGNRATKRQQEGQDDVEDNKMLTTNYTYGHSRPSKTVF